MSLVYDKGECNENPQMDHSRWWIDCCIHPGDIPRSNCHCRRNGFRGTVEIKPGEDDIYVFAETLLVNGTIQGDLLSFSTKVVIGPTGVVEGDLIDAGQVLDIQGIVKDDARVAGRCPPHPRFHHQLRNYLYKG